MDSWGYALRTNDAGPLLALSPKKQPCRGCNELASELGRRNKARWYVDFPGIEVSSMRLGGGPSSSVATATVSIPESDSYNTDGSFRNSNPAHADGSFEVRMRFVKGSYRLISFTVS